MSKVDTTKCFSCGGENDPFCSENTAHLCKLCYDETFSWTRRRAGHVEEQHRAKDVAEKAYAEMSHKYSSLQRSFQDVTKQLVELTSVNLNLTQQVAKLEERLSSVNTILGAVEKSNSELIQKISDLEHQNHQ
jgi:chromosome segregation ATPase